MSGIFKKIGKRLHTTARDFKNDVHYFNFSLAFVRMINNLTVNIGLLKKINNKSSKKHNEQLYNYIYSNYKYVFDKYENTADTAKPANCNAPVWVCWLTGEGTAPALVKKCIASIKKSAGSHPVNLITLENYADYISLPSYITEKYRKGCIGAAHFSDIIRMNLIACHGGLWLDATIFCNGIIPDEYFNSSFFSCKSPYKECGYVSAYRWTSFVLGGKKGSVFYSFMTDFYNEYWKRENRAIDYLFMDYVIVLAMEHIPSIRKAIEDVPVNNLQRDDYAAIMNEEFNSSKLTELLSGDTHLFKLSWRETYYEKTPDGKETFYGNLIKQ